MSKGFSDGVKAWRVEKRLGLAKQIIERLTHLASDLVTLHENNNIILYTDVLSKQIPRSYAANAFNAFRKTMHISELIRIAILWDKAGPERESIPTIIALIDDKTVIQQIYDDVCKARLDRFPTTITYHNKSGVTEAAPDENILRYRDEKAATEANSSCKILRDVILKAKSVETSSELASLIDLRNGTLAHSLAENVKMPASVVPLKCGDEISLFESSIEIIQQLYRSVNQVSFDIQSATRDLHAKNANELWSNCKFEIPDRSE